MKERRVTERESTTFEWVFKNGITPDLSQIQPFSLYLDSAKCNLDQNSNAAWVHTCYKYVAQKVKPVRLPDGCTLPAGIHLSGRAIAQAVPVPGPRDEYFIPQLYHRARRGWLTPRILCDIQRGNICTTKKQEGLLAMLSNREYALS